MTATATPSTTTEPIVDRDFAEKFLRTVDRPFEYGVYFLFHDWWAAAPDEAIEAYVAELKSIPGAEDFLAERYLADPIDLDDLEGCAPGTLGAEYRNFIVDNGLAGNLARNYHDYNAQLTADGTLDRLPDELSYAIVRGFQTHDFNHVMTGFSSKPLGELAQCAFHSAQSHSPYNAFRIAATTAHTSFVNPAGAVPAMDAFTVGWTLGRTCKNLSFWRWEDELDTPLADLRARAGIDPTTYVTV